MQNDLFTPYVFGPQQRAQLDRDGHFAFPGLLSAAAQQRLTAALAYIQSLRANASKDRLPNHYAAEYDSYLASLIGHPQLLGLVRTVLGPEIRYDHCVSLNREKGCAPHGWHTHSYGEEDPSRGLGFVRIFFYVNGFAEGDGGLKVVPGSHLYRDCTIAAASDEVLEAGWLRGKKHPQTQTELSIEPLSMPAGSVIAMWTHALHGVSGRVSSDTRWTVVYAYRNPGLPSAARWISPAFEAQGPPGTEGLLSLY